MQLPCYYPMVAHCRGARQSDDANRWETIDLLEQLRQLGVDAGDPIPGGGRQLRWARTVAMKCGRRGAWRARRSSTVIGGAT